MTAQAELARSVIYAKHRNYSYVTSQPYLLISASEACAMRTNVASGVLPNQENTRQFFEMRIAS
jgi:hypothetical protein